MKMLNINSFVDLCVHYAKTNGIALSPLKLQKALYYIQAWNVGYFDDQLFAELPEAWVNGPVYPSVYHQFKDYKGDSIVALEECNLEEDAANLHSIFLSIERDDHQKGLLQAVLDKYMSQSAGELVFQTHREKPWIDARVGYGPFEPSKNIISFEAMQDYYGGIVRKTVAAR